VGLKALALVCTLILSGCAAQQPATSPVPIANLTGVWISKDYIETIQRTKAPIAAARESAVWSGPNSSLKFHALSFSILRSGVESVYEFSPTNFHEGASYRILRVETNPQGGSDRLVIERFNRGDIDYVPMRFNFGAGGNLESIAASNVWGGEPEQLYVRLEDTVEAHVNRLVLAGRYKDSKGKEYSFSDSGDAHWPGLMFRYEVSLDVSEAGCEYFGHDDPNGVGGRKRYGYRWSGEILELYSIFYTDSSAECTMCCEPKPFAVLRRVD
jgi:hypothetical protein